MLIVTFKDEQYECAKAVKGDNYIHLLDEAGCITTAFEGIVDFSCFSISGGDWTVPSEDLECYLAIVDVDGRIKRSKYKCGEVSQIKEYTVTLPLDQKYWTHDTSANTYSVTFSATKVTDNSFIIIEPVSNASWAYSNILKVATLNGYITITAGGIPSADCEIKLRVLDIYNSIPLTNPEEA